MQVLLLLLQQLLFVVCVVSERELTVNETTWIAGSVSNNVIETVSFNIEEEHIDKAIRISTVSNEANLSAPIFISVRQSRQITSWTLPYVETGYAYSKVDRTLCPLLNQPLNDYTSHMIYIDISTPSHFNVSYNISAQFVHDYQLKFNNPINVSVLSPVFYVFEYPDNVDSALVKVTSQDISQCAIVSIQESICPNDQLLDYPEHRGTYQTMEKLAAINYQRPTHQNYIYVVISVYHHEDCTEANSDLIDGIITLNVSANYNPVHVNGNTSMSKDVTIAIDHTLSTSQYVKATLIFVFVSILIVLISVVWIVIDACCYRNHSSYKFLSKLRSTEEVDGPLNDMQLSVYKKCKRFAAIVIGSHWNDKFTEIISGSLNSNGIEGIDGQEDTIQRSQSYEEAINNANERGSIEINLQRAHHYLTLKNQRYIHQLHINNNNTIHKQYNVYWIYLIAIFLFYSIPAYQLILTYQKYVHLSGNQDFCYYNTLCSHPLVISRVVIFSAFNNIWSNIGFLVLGALFLIIAFRRRRMYKLHEKINDYYEEQGKPEAKLGIPQQFGIYYAAGFALIFESFLSAAYHFCPTGDNYQFDTAMMFVLVILGIYQLNKFRNPDIHASPHNLLLVLSLLILLIGIGVMCSGLIFYIVFFIIFEAATIYTSLQIYYRWKIKLCPTVSCLINVIKEFKYNITHPCPPQHKPKFAYFVISNILNLIFSVALLIWQPLDFATYFLFILVANFILSFVYLFITKVLCYREWGHKRTLLKPLIYFFLSILFWISGMSCYSMAVTNWLKSPAGSRNNNQQCILFGFYDTHDLWHFLSAFGIFFSFLFLMTIEDHLEFETRTSLHVF